MVSYLTALSSLASLRSIMTPRVAEPRPADGMTGVLRGAGRADHCRRHRGCGNRRVHGSRPLLATPPGFVRLHTACSYWHMLGCSYILLLITMSVADIARAEQRDADPPNRGGQLRADAPSAC